MADKHWHERLLAGAREAADVAAGRARPARVTVFFDPADLKAIRTSLDMSQQVFADRFGIPVETIRHWEQGRRTPPRAAMAFYQILLRQPEAALAAFA